MSAAFLAFWTVAGFADTAFAQASCEQKYGLHDANWQFFNIITKVNINL